MDERRAATTNVARDWPKPGACHSGAPVPVRSIQSLAVSLYFLNRNFNPPQLVLSVGVLQPTGQAPIRAHPGFGSE